MPAFMQKPQLQPYSSPTTGWTAIKGRWITAETTLRVATACDSLVGYPGAVAEVRRSAEQHAFGDALPPRISLSRFIPDGEVAGRGGRSNVLMTLIHVAYPGEATD